MTNQNKIYIAGKVTGLDWHETSAKFEKAENTLRALGYDVVNPMKEINPETQWNQAMRTCIIHLMSCNHIYLLDDWMGSMGAMIEKTLAVELEFNVYHDGINMPLAIKSEE